MEPGKVFLPHGRSKIRERGIPQLSFPNSLLPTQEWHDMEVSRGKAGKSVDGEFVHKWICLSMPVGATWTADLATPRRFR